MRNKYLFIVFDKTLLPYNRGVSIDTMSTTGRTTEFSAVFSSTFTTKDHKNPPHENLRIFSATYKNLIDPYRGTFGLIKKNFNIFVMI